MFAIDVMSFALCLRTIPLLRTPTDTTHSVPFKPAFHSIPFHSIPFHSIPFHSIPSGQHSHTTDGRARARAGAVTAPLTHGRTVRTYRWDVATRAIVERRIRRALCRRD